MPFISLIQYSVSLEVCHNREVKTVANFRFTQTLNDTAIKNSSFQWSHFCPKGPQRNYFLYLVQNRFNKDKGGDSKIPIKIHTCAKMYNVCNVGKMIKTKTTKMSKWYHRG